MLTLPNFQIWSLTSGISDECCFSLGIELKMSLRHGVSDQQTNINERVGVCLGVSEYVAVVIPPLA